MFEEGEMSAGEIPSGRGGWSVPVGPAVEVIIPSLGRQDVLIHTLDAIRQLYPNLAVRVALQGDDIRPLLHERFGRSGNFTVEYRPAPALIEALNHAVSNSRADICILLDDDAVPCDGWLEAHLTGLNSEPAVAYTYGREVNTSRWRSLGSEILRIAGELVFGLPLSSRTKLHGRIIGWTNSFGFVFANFHLPGSCVINAPAEGNLAFPRTLFLASGGFDERFTGNAWGYGPEWGLRLARQGLYGRYVGDAIMIHRQHATGGTRSGRRSAWYRSYVANTRIFVETVGPLGWIGAAPRLIRRYFVR
ncbi:glycosyltransferase family 2 protein [Consotaella aegiceratis]|uniref:glycosyltransferase family 2 protein n=1 Tax=Consotaella aegiceratis TaxID=3097961 RepID=UPI002F42623C